MTDATSRNEKPTGSGNPNRLLLPDPAKTFADQEPAVLLAMCLFGEARGESALARRAIAEVILNRARNPRPAFGSRPGATLEDNLRRVILQPWQFSCFLPNDPNYKKLLRPLDHESPAVWQRCLDAAREALETREGPDTLTAGSDHYFDDSLQPPRWADPAKQTVRIGRLQFYRLYLATPTAEAGGVPRAAAEGDALGGPRAEGTATAPPSRRESPPPGASCRAPLPSAHRREASGSGPLTSFPVPHLPSQRSPRLGSNRWYQRNRGLSSLAEGFVSRDSGFGHRGLCRGLRAARVALPPAPRIVCLRLAAGADREAAGFRLPLFPAPAFDFQP